MSTDNSKHTTGEWFAKDGQIYPIETGKTLALIPYFDGENEEQKANQKLIAAAPMLLDALQEAREYIIKYGKPPIDDKYAHNTLSKIRAALYSATN